MADKAWGRPSAQRLLKLLSIHRGFRLHKEEIQDILWPELGPDTVDNSFRRALHLCRHALEPDLPARAPSTFLALRRDVLELDPQSVWVDVHIYDAALRAGLDDDDAKRIEFALKLSTGSLLLEDAYEDWAQPARENHAALRLAAFVQLGALLLAEGKLDRARTFLDLALEGDPACEAAHRLLLELWGRRGDRGQAKRAYELCREALEQELGVEPAPETDAVYRQAIAGELASISKNAGASIAQAPEAARPGLPHTVGSTVEATFGRAEEISQATNWLDSRFSDDRSTAPLLLLSGDMGTGKTHLARLLASHAYQRGSAVLWGGWSESEAVVPYSAFVEAVDHIVASSQSGGATSLERYPELTGFVPTGAATRPASATASGDDAQSRRARLHASIGRVLADLESNWNVLFVLDDLHLSDNASLELLAFLLRLAPSHAWAFVGT
ncbi:MAG TPA: AAA family ATPase, partial [Chloroflexota bacterium]|nr:AAA family ATPase [Chloroflexota bacterium]